MEPVGGQVSGTLTASTREESRAVTLPDDFGPDAWLAKAYVEPAVHALRPDYRALLVLAEGLVAGPSDDVSDELLATGTAQARGHRESGCEVVRRPKQGTR